MPRRDPKKESVIVVENMAILLVIVELVSDLGLLLA